MTHLRCFLTLPAPFTQGSSKAILEDLRYELKVQRRGITRSKLWQVLLGEAFQDEVRLCRLPNMTLAKS